MGRCGAQEAQSERQAAVAGDRARASFGRLGHHLHLHQLSVEGQRRIGSAKVGSNTSVEWPAGIGAKGNEGVANNVGNTKGSIGYVETAYAKQNKLTTMKMINKDGKMVEAIPEAIMAAAAGADWAHAPGFYMIITDSPGAKSWPIAGATFILVPKEPKDAAAAKEALKFFAWAYNKGAEMAQSLDYVPMPDSRREPDPGQVEERHQGRRRQADLLSSVNTGKRRLPGAFSLSPPVTKWLVLWPPDRLSGAPRRVQPREFRCNRPGASLWSMSRYKAESSRSPTGSIGAKCSSVCSSAI